MTAQLVDDPAATLRFQLSLLQLASAVQYPAPEEIKEAEELRQLVERHSR